MFSGFNVRLDENTIGGNYFYDIGNEITSENDDMVYENLKTEYSNKRKEMGMLYACLPEAGWRRPNDKYFIAREIWIIR